MNEIIWVVDPKYAPDDKKEEAAKECNEWWTAFIQPSTKKFSQKFGEYNDIDIIEKDEAVEIDEWLKINKAKVINKNENN